MIPLPILNQLESFLLSDRVKIGGHEFGTFATLVGAVQAEKQLVSTLVPKVVRIPDDAPNKDQKAGNEAA